MMKNNQNVIIAIALSFVIIIAWQYFIIAPKMEAERKRAAAEQAQTVAATPGAPATQSATPSTGAATPAAPASATPGAAPPPDAATTAIVPRDAALARSDRVAIDTPSLKGSINLVGGRIDDLRLADYRVTVDPASALVELFSPAGSEHPYFADFGWVAGAGGPAVPGPDAAWAAEGGPLSPGKDVTLVWDNGAGLVFKRSYSIDAKYMFTVRQTVENATVATVALYPFGLVSRTGLPQTAGYYILHEGLIGYLGEEGLQEINYGRLDDELSITPDKVAAGWLGITARGRVVPTALPQRHGWIAADLPGGFPRRRRLDPGRRQRRQRDAALRRRQGNRASRRLRGETRDPALRAPDRLGLVLLHHQAAL
jgi:YidC/Oxa1 family membrane protein insertase